MTAHKENSLKLLVLRITDACNLYCRYCYARGGESKGDMPWEVARRAVDYVAARSGHFKIQFSGGEPLLNLPLIKKVVAYMQERNLAATFQLQTNGTLLTPAMVREIKKLGLALGVSLDGMPEVNDALRPFPDGKGSTLATIQGLQNLAAERVKAGLTVVLTAASTEQLPRLVELAAYLGSVHGLSLDLFRPLGRGAEGECTGPDPDLLRRQVRAALERAREIARQGGPLIRFREVERLKYLLTHSGERRYYCYATTGQSLAVLPDGSVYPCASLGGVPDFYLGSILDPDFSHQEAMVRRAWWRRNVEKMQGCRDCPERLLCGGGCLARAYAYSGRVDIAFPGDCELRKIFMLWVKEEGSLPPLSPL
ncbi:Anaerobic sulfatase-maturating enzyme [Neomoorella glycerini]|uniref:Anaerobic sulfatase-maturating enzyme n=1 Tax=Neomoorella glycerini TaxID=55779 RepID=A0A6I5ZWY2_9FIRM|nr:radical SAM protein [Moorella glycerini]QGP93841.1 Anaerobic sulfatase-maturating enzyme [Moorella glycerini]